MIASASTRTPRRGGFPLLMTVCLACWADGGRSEPASAAAPPPGIPAGVDWHLDPTPYRARVERSSDGATVTLDNGLVRRVIRVADGCATIALDDLSGGRGLLRAVEAEATVTIDGVGHRAGGLVGQPNRAFLRPEWLASLRADPDALRLVGFETSEPAERLAWKRVRHHAPDAVWPPPGKHLRLDFAPPGDDPPFTVGVHYELYDGLPAFSKWVVVTNRSAAPITVDRFAAERLAIVEQSNPVDDAPGVILPHPDCLHVETDQAFGGFGHEHACRHAVRWCEDPAFGTQVNYEKKMPCLLEVAPLRGPAQRIAPGESFESFRAFVLVHDSTDRERRGLAVRQFKRTLAPWVTENPLMHHLLDSRPEAVRRAIDQAAEVGFEMVILSFGSGFDAENDSAAHLAGWKDVADHARERGIDLGAYSLLSSRRIGGGNDVVPAPGEKTTFGHAPALTSPWGLDYFRKLRTLYDATGFAVLEHDGSYPGDWDTTPRPPLQRGLDDSQWAQWRIIRDWYGRCRGRGVYLNVPDHYFLAGSNKCGMGYRETNWSLPRAEQVIHTRQNIYDGTWERTPSMGWMFVPLAQYHGGGAAATIEPLAEHLDHYRTMMLSNLAFGVQACYRGPRLFDTDATRDMVREQVAWYKAHRDILESDVVHLRRADGRDWDGMLHVNPRLDERALLAVFNPLDEPIERTIPVPLYYAGLAGSCLASRGGAAAERVPLDRFSRAEVTLRIPAGGLAWVVFRAE
jgi:hypothetical protein